MVIDLTKKKKELKKEINLNETKRLNYPKQRRRVVYEGARTRSTTLTPQRNLNIVWEQQPTVVKRGKCGLRDLGLLWKK